MIGKLQKNYMYENWKRESLNIQVSNNSHVALPIEKSGFESWVGSAVRHK